MEGNRVASECLRMLIDNRGKIFDGRPIVTITIGSLTMGYDNCRKSYDKHRKALDELCLLLEDLCLETIIILTLTMTIGSPHDQNYFTSRTSWHL